jgi:hypothetical protein
MLQALGKLFMRRKPYTERGLKRLTCSRCLKSASKQWQTPIDGCWHPLCAECDIEMNRMMLLCLYDDEVDDKIDAYQKKVGVEVYTFHPVHFHPIH